MINFRYHIVSLMAVFLALAVGITLGVTLVGNEANKGLAAQAEQDREQVQKYRKQLEQQRTVNNYRDSYDKQIGSHLTAGMLSGDHVALVRMPDAPTGAAKSIRKAVRHAGGTVTSRVSVSNDVFDPKQADAVKSVLNRYRKHLRPNTPVAARVGQLLGRSLLSKDAGPMDRTAQDIVDGLDGSVIQLDRSGNATAQLVIVITAEAADPPTGAKTLKEHATLEKTLNRNAAGTVLAGPNSKGIDGTDVATVRADTQARARLSTVDVADLPSGVSTVIMAGKEQLKHDRGHYGAANSADAPAPELPIG